MRVSKQEVQALLRVFSSHLSDGSYSLYLFGSRADDQKRGGDIDLLLLVKENDFQKTHAMKSLLKFDLESAVGDQRVDLTIATRELLRKDPFLQSIESDLVELRL